MTLAASANVVEMAFATRSGTDRLEWTLVLVRVQTSLGDIDMLVDLKRAPVTAANFLKYVDAGLYDGGRFIARRGPTTTSRRRRIVRRWSSSRAASIPDERRRLSGDSARAHDRHRSQARPSASSRWRAAGRTPRRRTSSFCSTISRRSISAVCGSTTRRARRRSAWSSPASTSCAKIQQQPVTGQNLTPPVTITTIKRVAR